CWGNHGDSVDLVRNHSPEGSAYLSFAFRWKNAEDFQRKEKAGEPWQKNSTDSSFRACFRDPGHTRNSSAI
ncbi:MAG TPA: hypothetical protein VJ508_11065, partial [Saprospiraceae bacterium]|nr:hypothetical protein [Saprospiraceae bacterium]